MFRKGARAQAAETGGSVERAGQAAYTDGAFLGIRR